MPVNGGGGVDLLFDARHIEQSGIGTYISKQIPMLQEHFATRGLSLAILGNSDDFADLAPTTTLVRSQPGDAPMYSVQEQRAWDDALARVRPRAVWVPHYPFPLSLLRPRNRGIALFMTVHDAIHVVPAAVSGQNWVRRSYARTMLGIDVRRCAQIFAVSEATAGTLRELFAGAPLTVAPQPIDPRWLADVDTALSPVAAPYLAYVGNTQRHKNLPLLLKAYRQVARDIPQRLVIAGGGALVRSSDDRIRPLVDDLGDRVDMVGRVSFETLRALVARADLLVMPSLMEGAGLPPLEAMASQTAVLASDIPALRETCGSGAEFFDPHDAAGLARLIRHYALDELARSGLAQRGWRHVTDRQSRLSFTVAVEAIGAYLVERR
ncbi:glycosyltransferase family 4 protein [Mycolicibacterium novocastrense]|uniref:Glycosyl transferase, group 1 n=1 Tax=Mycolicibacterium novocastrense TaxID=59813 RepID=A0AAW5SS49_MYCNV|nr:glycosyltransferase family 1 protein [Mycolicibacterium novocastrense]MCV7026346.1 glycosyltransferase family 4 protein [Mycolicibacterium novocastrense]GAT11182.1 glycosyl transferase, group 1, precursor [Mycolicibacterium novocastrense]